MASLSLRHIYKIYQGGVKAVSDFNLDIDDKEFIVFVGPSGCGKSTTLRMVAGLEEISAGELYIDGKLVNDVEPKDRDIAMVFQNYALYPHMTVYDNMAFGLRLRKMNSQEIESRVKEAAQILGITPLLSRKPKALSGGQRQRVALGRAIVREPKVFLLDEPLSNLDAKLRVQMRTEITKLHNKLATTFIYVTHDQTEAMTMGTRIVVMKDGVIQQVDTPTCLYDNPENLFVASFLGSPQMNFFKARLVKDGGDLYAEFGDGLFEDNVASEYLKGEAPAAAQANAGEGANDNEAPAETIVHRIKIPVSRAKRLMDENYIGKEVIMGVRPEDIHDEEVFIAGSPDTVITAKVDVVEKLGNETLLYMNVAGKEDYTIARIDARCQAQAGDTVKLAVDAQHIHFFDPETELTIMGVPRVNMIPAKLIAQEGGLCVRFGNVKIDLPMEICNKLTDTSVINGDVVLGIAPADLKTFEGTDAEVGDTDVLIEGEVDFTEAYPRFTAAYSKVPGKKGFLVSKHPVDTKLTSADKIKMYVSPEAIQLYHPETGEKLLAYKAVPSNIAEAVVTVKENVATVQFGKSKIAFPTDDKFRENATGVAVYIDPKSITVGKEATAKSKTVVTGTVIDAESLGDYTLVYFAVEGFAPYFIAQIKGSVNYNIGDKVKMAVDATMLGVGKRPTVEEVIAEKIPEAPEYVFVEEKPAAKPVKEEVVVETAATADVEKPVKKTAAKKTAATAKKPAAKKTTAKK